MVIIVFLKRIFTNKMYWVAVFAALSLLLCSNIYCDTLTGKQYVFASLFYDENIREIFNDSGMSLKNIFLGCDGGYLHMFCPIIVGIPCILIKKTERLLMFRIGRNRYIISKFFSSLFASGLIVTIAYIIYICLGMIIVKGNMWDILLIKKVISVFIWGMYNSILAMVLAEFVENKYLILCIPFVLVYFYTMFFIKIIPYKIYEVISPSTYQNILLSDNKFAYIELLTIAGLIFLCIIIKKIMLERRCDCGLQ